MAELYGVDYESLVDYMATCGYIQCNDLKDRIALFEALIENTGLRPGFSYHDEFPDYLYICVFSGEIHAQRNAPRSYVNFDSISDRFPSEDIYEPEDLSVLYGSVV